MKKREIIEGVIKDYDFPNKGSFELDGKKVIVKGALPGQKVSCMVSKVRKDKAEARLLDVLERSEMQYHHVHSLAFAAAVHTRP